MPPTFEKFDTGTHADNPIPGFNSTHVLTSEIPLTDVDFDRTDILKEFGQIREATDCPLLQTLNAKPKTPQILGADKNQQLEVPCENRISLIGKDMVTAHPACKTRIKKAGLTPTTVPTDRLREVQCPFVYLQAYIRTKINETGITVPIALDAKNQTYEKYPLI